MWKLELSESGVREDFSWNFGTCTCIALVGGGGKTSLMDCWARTLTLQRQNVAVTTSTHLQIPGGTLAFDLNDLHRLWMQGSYGVLGIPHNGKLSPPDPEFLDQAMEQADVTFVEADGAKGFPCKAPGSSEPVIPEAAEAVAAVLGMSAIGRRIEAGCFRLEEMEILLGKSRTEKLSEADAVNLLCSEQGSRKGVGARPYFVVLNQCDTEETRASARRIAAALLRRGVAHVVLTHFEPWERNQFEKGISDA